MLRTERSGTCLTVDAPETFDGLCMMRYAHVFRDRVGGGTEQYLNVVDRALLERHSMTIVRTHLVADAREPLRLETEAIGRGQLVWAPIPIRHVQRSIGSFPTRFQELRRQRGAVARGHLELARSVMASALRNRCGHLRYPAMILSDELWRVLVQCDVRLLVLHWISYDLPTLVVQAQRRRVPVLLVNHFDNARLGTPLARGILRSVAGVGGVSTQKVPMGLKDRFVRLSDAVDAEFFQPMSDEIPDGDATGPILLPGRIAFGKGHADLLDAASRIRGTGLPVRIQFAGPVEEQACMSALEEKVRSLGLGSYVEFTGQVGQEQLRDLYQRAAVVALPSTNEGLGRVLLEAQSMGKPVVAYATGGVPEAIEDEVTGFLVQPGDVTGLANRLGELLASKPLRIRMGRSGRQFVLDAFSIGALIRRHEEFYREALGMRRCAHGVSG